jgi:DNA-binding NarL/FixJ family response regulator
MTDSEKITRLLLVNETRLMGNIMAAALADEPDIIVIAGVSEPAEALQVLQQQHIDVVLISTRLPDDGAIRLISEINELAPSTKVLALGMTEDRQRVLRYVEAGAAGYVLRDDSLDDLIQTVRAARAGKAFVSPEIAAAMARRLCDLAQMFSGAGIDRADMGSLTRREAEVLELMGQRMTNQQIAEKLVIEVGTVKNHVHKILEKLDVGSRAEAAAYLAFIKK